MKTHWFPIRFLLITGVLIPLAASAALTWETEQVDLRAMAGTPEIVTTFPFRNTGDTPVTIISLRTSCDCTTAEVDKRDYAPGENGRIEVKFHPGERTGLVERLITATTSDHSTITMHLRVTLLEPVSLSAKTLTWTKDESPIERTVDITANAPSPIRAITINPDEQKKFATARLKAIEPTRHYRLTLAPPGTKELLEIPLHCRLEFPDGTVRQVVISVVVK